MFKYFSVLQKISLSLSTHVDKSYCGRDFIAVTADPCQNPFYVGLLCFDSDGPVECIHGHIYHRRYLLMTQIIFKYIAGL